MDDPEDGTLATLVNFFQRYNCPNILERIRRNRRTMQEEYRESDVGHHTGTPSDALARCFTFTETPEEAAYWLSLLYLMRSVEVGNFKDDSIVYRFFNYYDSLQIVEQTHGASLPLSASSDKPQRKITLPKKNGL